jgi:hypothetical protein
MSKNDIEITPGETSLTVGDDYAKKNAITFTIKLTGDGSVFLRLQIPVGENGVLGAAEDANNIKVETPGTVPEPSVCKDDIPPATKCWWLGNPDNGVKVNGSTTLSVSISNILCRAKAGESNIEVTMMTETPPDITATLKITKEKPKEWQNPILYFTVEPNFLISGQGNKVTLRWDLADTSGTVSLEDFRGNPIPNPTPGMTDEPDKTGNYTLKLGNYQKKQNVDVLSKNSWDEPDLRLGANAFPTVIFDADDKCTDALYAIFFLLSKGGNEQTVRTPVLCRSVNGISRWERCDPENVPPDMASSPGVRVKDRLYDRLYLIGGSSVDWDQKSRTICYYDLNHRNKGWREATVTFDADFEERMGHACVVVGDNIWVMGGSGRFGSLNDAWELTIDHSSDPIRINAKQIEKSEPAEPNWEKRWAPRCMFSAVHYNDQVWVFGGVESPQGSKTLDGIYYRDVVSKDKVWSRRDGQNVDVVKDAIGTGVAHCRDELFTVITNSTGGTVIHELTRSTSTEDDWYEITKTPARPAKWTSSNHSITLVGFNNRLYLRYLHRDALRWDLAKKGTPPGSLHVYIPNWKI